MSKNVEQREKIVAKYLENPNKTFCAISKSLSMHHFTVNRVINKFKEMQMVQRKPGIKLFSLAKRSL